MSRPRPNVIELTEYRPRHFSSEEIPERLAERLWRHYSPQVTVESPSFKTGQKWRLTAQGWAGHIPLAREVHFYLRPKVALDNLFGMLEYAYGLKSFRFLEGLANCQSLAEFYERLAHVLRVRVLERSRRGLYRAYVAQTERLPYLRGRLEARPEAQRPGQVRLKCHYEEHTADNDDNQILAWTLDRIARSGLCTDRVGPTVRRAYRTLQGPVTLAAHSPKACLERLYNRLNDDYRPMHALCCFFLEHTGPGHNPGDRQMLPFLVDMARLYELFVAKWLKAHLPPDMKLQIQERVPLGQTHCLSFNIDLVLSEAGTGLVHAVLDTKYKMPAAGPAADDVHQMISYAHTKGCREAILIYPAPLPQPFDETIRGIRVRSSTFSLQGDLEQAGQRFRHELMETI